MSIGTHKLKPQGWFRNVWSLGGKINQTFRHFENANYIRLQFALENTNLKDTLSRKIWSPKIFTAIMMSVSSLGLYMTPSGAAILSIQPSQLAWNRSSKKIKRNKNETKSKRIRK